MRFQILKNSKYGFIFSGILIAMSLFFLLTPGFRLSLGIDFTGGTEIIWSFADPIPSTEEITTAYQKVLGEDEYPKISELQNSDDILIRSHTLSPEQQITLAQNLPQGTVQGASTVGASLGEYFQQQALITILLAIVVIILFVAWAFRSVPSGISSWRFGVAAIVALLHDVLIIAGVFAFLGQFINLEVDTLFVTALLTVLGFSVHDTIVVFDRLRENLQGKKLELFEQTAEDALWQTMGRSIHTSVSTLFVLVAVLIWGAPSLFAFVFALAFGIFIGTYSSIFIAMQVLVIWVKNDIANYSEPEDEYEKEATGFGEGFDENGKSVE